MAKETTRKLSAAMTLMGTIALALVWASWGSYWRAFAQGDPLPSATVKVWNITPVLGFNPDVSVEDVKGLTGHVSTAANPLTIAAACDNCTSPGGPCAVIFWNPATNVFKDYGQTGGFSAGLDINLKGPAMTGTPGSAFGAPTFGPGDTWVAVLFNTVISIYVNPAGSNNFRRWAVPSGNVRGVKVDQSTGLIYGGLDPFAVGGTGGVIQLNPSTNAAKVWPVFPGAPHYVAIDSAGRVYTAASDSPDAIVRVDPATNAVTRWPIIPGGLSTGFEELAIDGLNFDQDGNLWLAMSAGNKVGRLNPVSNEMCQFTKTEVMGPQQIASSGSGSLLQSFFTEEGSPVDVKGAVSIVTQAEAIPITSPCPIATPVTSTVPPLTSILSFTDVVQVPRTSTIIPATFTVPGMDGTSASGKTKTASGLPIPGILRFPMPTPPGGNPAFRNFPSGMTGVIASNSVAGSYQDESFAGNSAVFFLSSEAIIAPPPTIQPTTLAFTAASATTSDFHDPATVQAKLTKTSDGSPVPGEMITFTLGSGSGAPTCSATTDATGTATCSLTPNQPAGTFTLTAMFAGDSSFGPSSASTTFTVTKEETATKFTATSPTLLANGMPATFSATLKEDGVTAISGRTLTFTLGSGTGAQSCTGTTNSNGTASCTIVVNQPLGPNTVAANFASDAFFRPSSDTEVTTVSGPRVTLSTASLNFGSQPIGTTSPPQTVTLTNSGNAPLTITSIVASGDFAQTNTCGSSLAPGASCIITAAFTPTAIGTREGSIAVTDNAPGSPHVVSLTGVGILAPVITLSSTSLIFGSRLIGTTSPSQTSTLTNSGTAVLNITSIAASGDFAQTNNCGTNVAVGAGCTISVTFNPTTAGFRTGGVTITSDARGSVPVITLTGIGFAPGISLSSTILIFADQFVGTTSAPQTVALNNGSGTSLAITSIVASGDFAQTNTCGSSVASGSGCTISVTFTPTARGTRLGAITITDSGSGSPRTITLSGTGAAPVVTLIPPSLTFTGNQTVGTKSLPLPVTLTNGGNATLILPMDGIAASLNFFQSSNCGNSLAAGASCTISVAFTPTMPGLLTGTITIADNAADSPQKINLTGNAIETGPAVNLSPVSLTFASQPLGTISAPQTVTLTNTGNATLTIRTIVVPSGDFTPASGTTCANGGSLAAGASCTINISFAPTAIGTRAGAITITDDAGGSPHVINLIGTGTPSGPAVNLSTANLSFGSQPRSTTSPTQVVTLTNGGTVMLTITSVDPSGDFAPAAGTTCKNGTSVAAGASCTISVTFTPTATGTRNGAITIADNAPGAPHAIALTGIGTDFSITTPPGSTNAATISAGQAATYTMTLAPSGGFNDTITMSCSGAPPGGACSVSPSAFTLNTTTKITITVTTTARSNAVPVSGPQGVPPLVAPSLDLPWLLWLLAVTSLGSLAMFGRKRASLAFGMTMLFALLCLGCAGGASAPAPVGPTAGTPPGNYAPIVTASTSNGFSHSSPLSLTVK